MAYEIPHFTPPDAYTKYMRYNTRPFSSPADGPIVELFDGVFQAHQIQGWMCENGKRLPLTDFQDAAVMAYPDMAYDPQQNMAGVAFNAVFNRLLKAATDALPPNPAYEISPYTVYKSWRNQAIHRRQFLLSAEATYDTYAAYRQSPNPKHGSYKFLRVFDVMFDNYGGVGVGANSRSLDNNDD
jgi:hypothetical protein